MKMNDLSIFRLLPFFVYIAQQILLIVVVLYMKTNETNGSSYFLIVFFVMLYLSILYGYKVYSNSRLMGLLFGFMEYLLFYPFFFTAEEYSCKKCQEIDISSSFTSMFSLFVIGYFITLFYLELCSKVQLSKKKRIFIYTLPVFLISGFIVGLKLLDDFILT